MKLSVSENFLGRLCTLLGISLLWGTIACSLAPGSQAIPTVDAKLYTLDATAVSLSSFHGRPLIVSFWASWCPVCTHNLKTLNAVYPHMRARGFEFLAIAVDDEFRAVQAAARSLKLDYPILYDRHAEAKSIFGVRGIPETYRLDEKGRIQPIRDPETGHLREKLTGPRNWNSTLGVKALSEPMNPAQ